MYDRPVQLEFKICKERIWNLRFQERITLLQSYFVLNQVFVLKLNLYEKEGKNVRVFYKHTRCDVLRAMKMPMLEFGVVTTRRKYAVF